MPLQRRSFMLEDCPNPMRLLLWLLTIAFALGGLAVRADHGFAGAELVGRGCLILALFACPLLWARPGGLLADMTGGLIFTGKDRLMLALAMLLAAPLILPWPF
jgi:hypothetical protein